MSITIRAVGQAARRGATRRVPNAAALLAALDDWLVSETADAIRRHTPGARTADGALEVSLHPAAPPVRLEATDGGQVTVTATTVPVGPGYHTFVCRLLERMADDVDIAWAPLTPPPAEPAKRGTAGGEVDPVVSSDPTGTFGSGDRRDAESGHLGWLHATLLAVREARRRGATGLHLATPPGVLFTFDGAVATVLGPRDDAWLERALADPRVAADIWPWVADAMDARYHLARALTLLWTEVRWRAPGSPDEVALFDEVLGTLRHAYPLEPNLPWPWDAWREIFVLRGQPDAATWQRLERAAVTAAKTAGPPAEPIGYRRQPVTIVHEGWMLELPGSFSEQRTPEEWSGGEAGRMVTLAATETAVGDDPMSAETFLREFAGHLGRDAIEHVDEPVHGRARLFSDTSSGIEVATVEGYSAVRGRGAVIRIVIEDPQDWKWALDTWRGLRPA